MKKKPPKFKSIKEECVFWESEDSTPYLDWISAKPAEFPNLRPTTRSVSIRLPIHLIALLKQVAHKQDVPYQSLIKLFLQEKIARITHQARYRKAA